MAEPATKKILGRGLQALLDDFEEEQHAPIERAASVGQTVAPIDKIRPNPRQPRKSFDERLLEELAESLREQGVIQPIVVRPTDDGEADYEIIAGERRWRAAQRANLHEVPIVIRETDEANALELAIIENVQRSDLNAIEEAIGYRQLIDRYGYSQDALSKKIGKSRSHIANIMRLTNLPDRVQDMVRSGELSGGHARALLSSNDPESLALRAVNQNLSVRDLEAAAKKADVGGSSRSSGAGPKEKDADTLQLEGELSAALRMPVVVVHKGRNGGELRITYRTLEDLEEVCARLRGEAGSVLASA